MQFVNKKSFSQTTQKNMNLPFNLMGESTTNDICLIIAPKKALKYKLTKYVTNDIT